MRLNNFLSFVQIMTPVKAPRAKKQKAKRGKKTSASADAAPISVSTSSNDTTVSKKRKHRDDEGEETGGLKLLKRKCVTMKQISQRKSARSKRVVLFTRKGVPYGKVATKMKSYIGVITRRKIPIIRKSWVTATQTKQENVTAEEKEMIWSRVKVFFRV